MDGRGACACIQDPGSVVQLGHCKHSFDHFRWRLNVSWHSSSSVIRWLRRTSCRNTCMIIVSIRLGRDGCTGANACMYAPRIAHSQIVRSRIARMLGKSLGWVEGESEHKRMRALVGPSLSPEALRAGTPDVYIAAETVSLVLTTSSPISRPVFHIRFSVSLQIISRRMSWSTMANVRSVSWIGSTRRRKLVVRS